MNHHHYTFPQVHELLPARLDTRPPDRRPSQRELVAASLLLRPVKRQRAW
jgi:hypothetical protein